MTANEFIQLNSDKVRRDSSLMLFYIDLFYKTFDYKPNCAGCTFNSDFYKLKRALSKEKNVNLSLNKKVMEKTFKLKKVTNTILSFKKDKVTHRLYDTNLNEDFVVGYLTNGTEEEIAERKKLFSKLPKLEEVEEVVVKKERKKKTK